MSGKVRVWPDGRIVIETDEPVSPEAVEMIARSIRERSLLVLGKGWVLEHESDALPDFGVQMPPPASLKWQVGDLVLAAGIGAFMVLLAAMGIVALVVMAAGLA